MRSPTQPQISRVTRTKAQASALYDRLSRWYDLLAGSFEDRHRAAGAGMLDPQPGDAVLEIGCGTGRSLLALGDVVGASGRVYGLDLARGMLDVSRARLSKAGLSGRVVLVRGDGAHLPFATDTFDRLFLSFTLELFDTPEIPVVLAECRRVLRAGGHICVVAMSKVGAPSRSTRIYARLHRSFPRFFDCRPIYAQASLQQSGFRVVDTSGASLLGLSIEIVLAESR